MNPRRTFFIVALSAVAIAIAGFAFQSAYAQTATTGVVVMSTDPNAGVAAAVQSYFADIPVMIAIARCESGPRQFMSDGTPLRGGNGNVIGIFQLDETIHAAKALSLGFNINTVAGNMGYARYLYGTEGTEPWISSFGCWNSALTATTTTTITATTTTVTSTPLLTINLSLGAIDPQVLVLQQLLNKDGFTVATSGPGSVGQETTKFGAFTWAALKSFQCAQGIACSGEEATTGYGYLNAATRGALNSFTTSTVITISTSTATSTVVTTSTDDSAEIAELQSRVAALLTVIAQLKALIAARVGTH